MRLKSEGHLSDRAMICMIPTAAAYYELIRRDDFKRFPNWLPTTPAAFCLLDPHGRDRLSFNLTAVSGKAAPCNGRSNARRPGCAPE